MLDWIPNQVWFLWYKICINPSYFVDLASVFGAKGFKVGYILLYKLKAIIWHCKAICSYIMIFNDYLFICLFYFIILWICIFDINFNTFLIESYIIEIGSNFKVIISTPKCLQPNFRIKVIILNIMIVQSIWLHHFMTPNFICIIYNKCTTSFYRWDSHISFPCIFMIYNCDDVLD